MKFITNYKYFILSLLALMLVFSTSTFAKKKVRKICIDAGHGGKDPGAVGQYNNEKTITLAVSKKLEKMILQNIRDVKVVNTRDYDVLAGGNDLTIKQSLVHRTEFANKEKADLFISIHVNSSPRRLLTSPGTLVLICGQTRLEEKTENITENVNNISEEQELLNPNDPTTQILIGQYSQAFLSQSIVLGSKINDEFGNQGRPSRGLQQQSLQVLASCAMPGVLIEIGFMNNTEDEAYLSSEEGQIEVATAIFNGIKGYKDVVEEKTSTQETPTIQPKKQPEPINTIGPIKEEFN
jgi:N-acetylmuramoyl-L-alanine amidase